MFGSAFACCQIRLWRFDFIRFLFCPIAHVTQAIVCVFERIKLQNKILTNGRIPWSKRDGLHADNSHSKFPFSYLSLHYYFFFLSFRYDSPANVCITFECVLLRESPMSAQLCLRFAVNISYGDSMLLHSSTFGNTFTALKTIRSHIY